MTSVPLTLQELERRLAALASAQRNPDRGPEPDQEAECFRLIDALDQDANASEALAAVGTRFAEQYVTPYIHAYDLTGVLSELDGLLAIHRRGRLRIDTGTDVGTRVVFEKLGDDLNHAATAFDAALVTHAVRTRFPHARIEPESQHDDEPSYTFWRIHTS